MLLKSLIKTKRFPPKEIIMIKYFQIFFVSIMLISCSYNNEVVSWNEVNGTWDKKKKELLFTMNIEDTSTPKNIIFLL